LAGAPEKKFAETIAALCIPIRFAAQDERAGAIAEESAKFPGDTARSESAAVDVGGNDSDGLSLAGPNERVRDCQGIEQSQARASDIECAASFANEQARMQLSRERRVIVVRLAGGDDPVHLLRAAGGGSQSGLRGFSAEHKFVFSIVGVGDRFNAGTAAQLANGHAKRAVDLFRGKNTRAHDSRGRNNGDILRPCQIPLLFSCGPWGHHNSSSHSIAESRIYIFAPGFDEFLVKQTWAVPDRYRQKCLAGSGISTEACYQFAG
jgi:hypothetical protein